MNVRCSVFLLGFVAFLEGCPSCPYEEVCEGNVLRYCYLGVDQLVGSPDEGVTVCRAPNPACVTIDARNAACAMATTRTCMMSVLPYCEGALLVECAEGYEVAYDCAAHGNVCGIDQGTAKCHRDPIVRCPTMGYEESCEGNLLLECSSGAIESVDCAIEVPQGTCTPFTNDYGSGAYCRAP